MTFRYDFNGIKRVAIAKFLDTLNNNNKYALTFIPNENIMYEITTSDGKKNFLVTDNNLVEHRIEIPNNYFSPTFKNLLTQF